MSFSLFVCLSVMGWFVLFFFFANGRGRDEHWELGHTCRTARLESSFSRQQLQQNGLQGEQRFKSHSNHQIDKGQAVNPSWRQEIYKYKR